MAESDLLADALQEYCNEFRTPLQELKPLQRRALDTILSKKDCICSLPTGYGKSLIYEILPFLDKNSLVIVIVPLNAIIDQQLKKLGEKAISVCHGDISKVKLQSQELSYLFCHPEQVLNTPEIIKFFSTSHFQERNKYLVIDEAHCIIEWGEEFRKDFRKLYQLRSLFVCTVIALSATITKSGQSEIAKSLMMTDYHVVCSSPAKDNITLMVKERPNASGKGNTSCTPYDFIFIPIIQKLKNELGNFCITIVYCKTMNWIGYGYELAKRLLGEDFYAGEPLIENARVVMFHSSMEGPEGKLKRHILETLQQEEPKCTIRLIFSSVALGMGADLRNVKRVIHAGPPTSLETYVQEIGRAGRTGAEADAVLYYNKSDIGGPHMKKEMKEYCKNSDVCRRDQINKYFGFESSTKPANCCDVCTGELGLEWDFSKLQTK